MLYVSLSGFIQNLYLVAQLGALWLIGIFTFISFLVVDAEHGILTVLFSLTNAVDDLLKSSI